MIDQAQAVGDRLRRARRDADLSQRELAQTSGTSQAAVARYETGRVLPDLRTLDRLLSACGRRLRVEAVSLRRTGRESAAVRPVAIPYDLDVTAEPKAIGVVEAPGPHQVERATENLRPRRTPRPGPRVRAGAARGNRERHTAIR